MSILCVSTRMTTRLCGKLAAKTVRKTYVDMFSTALTPAHLPRPPHSTSPLCNIHKFFAETSAIFSLFFRYFFLAVPCNVLYNVVYCIWRYRKPSLTTVTSANACLKHIWYPNKAPFEKQRYDQLRGHFSPVEAFFRRNTLCISRRNNDEWRKTDPKLGALMFFKQAIHGGDNI
jgi:hypothetical protein